jgi:Protein of unknown function (DUF3551)
MAAAAPAFANNAQRLPHPDYGVFRHTFPDADHAKVDGHSWCLRDYSDGINDCSFGGRAQCEATAAGGLGECMIDP